MTAQPEQRQQHTPRAGELSTMESVRLRRVNHWPAQGLGGELADLYVDHHEASAAEAHRSRSRQDFLNRLTGDIRRAGFAMVIAETDHLVGCAFGFPVCGDGFWWLGFDGPLPQSLERLTASGGVFAITDILVRPHPQDQDVARRLQERLLSDHQASYYWALPGVLDRLAAFLTTPRTVAEVTTAEVTVAEVTT